MGQLEIHVFGGRKGESIAIRFPNNRWAVVDCFAASQKRKESNAVLRFLRDQNVSELCFACLTHPHEDHYSGMRHIIEELRVSEFWYPSAMSEDRLKFIFRTESLRLFTRKQHAIDPTEPDELMRLWHSIFLEGRKITPRPIGLGWASWKSDDYFGGCSIEALSPTPKQIARYEFSLRKMLDGDKIDFSSEGADENRISIALRIVFGNTKVILGGDVESGCWREILSEDEGRVSEVRFFKIPHHGGQSAYVERVWDLASTGTNTDVAIVTPYTPSGLPESTVIRNIIARDREVWSAGFPAEEQFIINPQSGLFAVTLPSEITNDGSVGIYLSSDGTYSLSITDKAMRLEPRI